MTPASYYTLDMPDQTKYNVIVMGAGMAGLSATQHLADLGHSVLLLEAKNRVGGRIHTLKTEAGYPIEMGADKLLNPGTVGRPNPLVPWLDTLNLSTTPIEAISSDFFKAPGYFEEATRCIHTAKQHAWQTWPSLGELLKHQRDFIGKQALIHLIQQHTGTSIHNVPLLELMQGDTSSDLDEAFIAGGYQQLPEAIAKKASATGNVKMLLNTPVEAVHYLPEKNTTQVIATNGEIYTAKCVLCTLPLGVLQNNSIHFSPALSNEKKTLIKNLQIGFHNKVILEFKTVFWPTDTHFLFPGSQNYHYFPEYFNLFHFSNQKIPALVCHFYASKANFKENTDDHIVEEALLPLRETYGKAAMTLKDAFITHWESDTYALGSTSCYGLNNKMGELENFEKPEQGGLFFAGAHTLANKKRETVQGAYISGVRAALDINHHLKKHLKLKAKY